MLAAGRAVQLCLKRVCGMSLSLQAAGVSSLHSLPWHKEGGGMLSRQDGVSCKSPGGT